MRLVAILHTSVFRGDHETDVQIPFEPLVAESVEGLVDRIRRQARSDLHQGEHVDPTDFIEIREVRR